MQDVPSIYSYIMMYKNFARQSEVFEERAKQQISKKYPIVTTEKNNLL